jgi:hypothetical protein
MVFGSTLLLVGLVLSAVNLPVEAAESTPAALAGGEGSIMQACTPPHDWDLTVRVGATNPPTKQWSFQIGEPEMDVKLTVFYYQDYDKRGCPFDCATGECQMNETGRFETPLGNIEVPDGVEGAQGGSHKFEGRLTQGSYQVVFIATGMSINVGVRVLTASLPTGTPLPTFTPTAVEPTQTPTATPVDSITPSVSPTTTGTVLPTVNPPDPTNTPPGPEFTPTPTSISPTNTPLPTLEPPPPPANATPGGVLIPVTGDDLTGGGPGAPLYIRLFLFTGVGFLGLGLVFNGAAARYTRPKKMG